MHFVGRYYAVLVQCRAILKVLFYSTMPDNPPSKLYFPTQVFNIFPSLHPARSFYTSIQHFNPSYIFLSMGPSGLILFSHFSYLLYIHFRIPVTFFFSVVSLRLYFLIQHIHIPCTSHPPRSFLLVIILCWIPRVFYSSSLILSVAVQSWRLWVLLSVRRSWDLSVVQLFFFFPSIARSPPFLSCHDLHRPKAAGIPCTGAGGPSSFWVLLQLRLTIFPC